jgi:hypothetical protein
MITTTVWMFFYAIATPGAVMQPSPHFADQASCEAAHKSIGETSLFNLYKGRCFQAAVVLPSRH